MADVRGFLKLGRELPKRRPVPVRLRDWREVYEPFDFGDLTKQASRCMDCGVPFCNEACPLGNIIPDWNDLVYRNRWFDAIERLHATNNFPEFTGRLCPAPCEGACVLGINQDPVTIKQVELELIDHAWEQGWVVPLPSVELTGRSVAVIGSGPAGLAAAQQLTRAGHAVTVFERADRLGGLLRYGIPEFKMEKRHIDRRLDQMRSEGTKFVTEANIGVDRPASQIVAEFDAVVLAGGATQARDLPIAGRELNGVHQAMEYLTLANQALEEANNTGNGAGNDNSTGTGAGTANPAPVDLAITAQDKSVVIIGGGDTGADCLGTAHRQGASSISQFEIMPRPPDERAQTNPWPTYPMIYRVSSAHEEGGERVYSVNTEQFVGDTDGNLTALQAHEVELVDGKFEKVSGSDFEHKCELVLLAMGFVGPEQGGLLEQLGVATDERSNVVRDDQYRTSVDGVWVCGDMGRGQSLIVWAIAEGRACAAAVDAALMGTTALPMPLEASARPLV